MPYPIDGHDGQTVGHGMTALHELPCLALARLLLGCVAALVADGGGIDEDVGAGKGHEACALGVPLVPADLHAEASDGGLYGLEAEVAGGEIELLVVGGVVGDVHLAMYAGDAAILLKDDGGVVVEPCGTALEEAGDEHDSVFTRERAIERGGGPGDGLCQVEELHILCLTEVGRVVQFLQHDELSATGCDVSDGGSDARAVVIGGGGAGVLDESELH